MSILIGSSEVLSVMKIQPKALYKRIRRGTAPSFVFGCFSLGAFLLFVAAELAKANRTQSWLTSYAEKGDAIEKWRTSSKPKVKVKPQGVTCDRLTATSA